ncbi:hypothetical protein ARMGADRAFT_1039300 [Armillaria gallica]|uniref:Uncharacterized protein n=1 Tax=Armillaria gallica TaxID=47427 RepID=A0A2H3CSU7_ARMGA|nr:hypothetical protein ARMGADRAFT_1039300 [Armillaria gallica]
MATQADIPLDLTDTSKALIFQSLDTLLNSRILFVQLYGMYTGILTVTLWNIFINKCWPIRQVMVVVVILLYALITVDFATNMSYTCPAFIDNGNSFWTVYLKLSGKAQAAFWVESITASMSTIITDLYMLIIVPPQDLVLLDRLGATLAYCSASNTFPNFCNCIVSKVIEIYQSYFSVSTEAFKIPVLYISSILMTTLWRGAGRLRVYHHFIEVLVESSALYSISLILYLALTIHNNDGLYYLDVIVGVMKGIAPTLLIGRFTVGHRARPDNSWQGSVIGSASIRSQGQEHSWMSFREDDRASPMLGGDLEAQRESSVTESSPTFRSVSVVADYAHANPDISPETLPCLRNCSLLHDHSSLYEETTHDSTVVDEVTALSR